MWSVPAGDQTEVRAPSPPYDGMRRLNIVRATGAATDERSGGGHGAEAGHIQCPSRGGPPGLIVLSVRMCAVTATAMAASRNLSQTGSTARMLIPMKSHSIAMAKILTFSLIDRR